MAKLHRRILRLALGATIVLSLMPMASPVVVFASDEPNGNASCIGLEMASISPPGSSDEVPGGAPRFVGEVKGLAAALGVPNGALFKFIASLHAGSHADCDQALGG